ncbi:MAG: alginate lyase family protein [Prevotella sp.]|uniref:alginate lyase family protein n=1 Tax=Prevotella sp. TaxID=59823 RepID=UPI002A33B82D|nr:alginate lyase family protein [Prevotella sp.]MDD7317925.1 alginate lyase family protein [Prevotellaceae bacterium]MDY4020816.1 alginate lyase family protein [Prevotella sp.]
MKFNENCLGLNFDNVIYGNNTHIRLLGGYDYNTYKKKWHAGFQTPNEWERTFSYNIDYKQRDDVGDARTNWELNRHFQFGLLAKSVYVKCNSGGCWKEDFDELASLFYDWNKANPFLHGISWTSVMEVAIRSVSWMYALAFLRKAGRGAEDVCMAMEIGIVNMVDYVSKHYSRYSSANNHLLVEALAIGIAGYAFNHESWKLLAVSLLSDELYRQNYSDGVNKELSLHYQTFGMEAYALMSHVMRHNGDVVPAPWIGMLEKQCVYVSHSLWNDRCVMEFGDDDEGKILDLQGGDFSHPIYILQFCSLVLGKKFSTFDEVNETLRWLFNESQIKDIMKQETRVPKGNRCFSVGGNTFLRDEENRVLIGIDHAALGFGTIAAHGHADMLSLQMMVDGKTILVDPGTFIYHCNIYKRNWYRKTINHNTMTVEDRDQSEMLGAFLWGRKAKCSLVLWEDKPKDTTLVAEHDGYHPVVHRRTVKWNSADELTVVDNVSKECNWVITWMLASECNVKIEDKCIVVNNGSTSLFITSSCGKATIEDVEISRCYGLYEKSVAIRISGHEHEHVTKIWIKHNK